MPLAFRTLAGDGTLQNPYGWLLSRFRANRLNHELRISTLLSACSPPLMMFIIGSGIEYLPGVPFSSAMCVQWQAFRGCCCFRCCQRNRQNGVCTEVGFVVSTVQLDHDLIDVRRSLASLPFTASAIGPLTAATALVTPLPETRLITVTQLQCFA